MTRLIYTVTTVLLLLIAMGMAVAPIQAEERILSFDSRIEVNTDGSTTVNETIRVVAEGKEIKRGIYRDLPTRRRFASGEWRDVSVEVLEARRNNLPVFYWTEDTSDGVRLYIGEKNVFIDPGLYTYEVTYRSDRQIDFLDDADELHWNVTGRKWTFPIDQVTATVILPEGAEILREAAYTGEVGAQGDSYIADRDQRGNPRFRAARQLAPGEGFSIRVAWPSGVVVRPLFAEESQNYQWDNRPPLVALVEAAARIVRNGLESLNFNLA